jgi:four helix bundle protein
MKRRAYDLEDRFVNYACAMIEIVELLPDTRSGKYIAAQLIRSCNSPAFNYGEVQAAESRNDFIHKLKIVLKELKECRIALKIIIKKEMIKSPEKIQTAFKETEELIAIAAASIETAKKNQQKQQTQPTNLNIEY